MKMQDNIMNIFKTYDAVGGNIIIASNNKILEQFTYGYQSKEKGIVTKENTIYRIASISKVIVASSLMTLYDEGLVDIQADISQYLGFQLRNPNYPEDIITLEMVMTQTSSICDGEDPKLGYDGVNGPRFFVSLERLLTDPTYEYYTEKTFLKAKPGSTFCYSNFGCGILACVIEKITGMYFTDFVRERLLLPMGLDASFRIEDIQYLDCVASLYDEENGKLVLCRDKNLFLEYMFPRYELGNNFRGPAGGLFISPTDLTIFMQMLMNEGVVNGRRYLKKETVQWMKEIHWQTNDKPDGLYEKKGLQLLILDRNHTRLYGHTGSAYGLRSFMLFNNHIGYIFMCNGAKYVYEKEGITSIQDKCLSEMMNYESRNH